MLYSEKSMFSISTQTALKEAASSLSFVLWLAYWTGKRVFFLRSPIEISLSSWTSWIRYLVRSKVSCGRSFIQCSDGRVNDRMDSGCTSSDDGKRPIGSGGNKYCTSTPLDARVSGCARARACNRLKTISFPNTGWGNKMAPLSFIRECFQNSWVKMHEIRCTSAVIISWTQGFKLFLKIPKCSDAT